MQLSPQYGDVPVLRFEPAIDDPSAALLRQRRRLGELLAGLNDDQWSTPSRCDEWSVQDVVAHLVTTNQFWTFSMKAGLGGEPTRFLATFDPVTSPAEIVAGMRQMSPAETLRDYVETVDAMAAVVEEIDEPAWATLAEAPPGHVAMHAVALHALWDSWIHERDIAIPVGSEPAVVDDEVRGCLLYAAALGPAFYASTGSARSGALGVVATAPDVSFVVHAGPTVVIEPGAAPAVDGPCLRGDAVALVEGISFRGPLDHDLDDDDVWLVDGLAEVFDTAR